MRGAGAGQVAEPFQSRTSPSPPVRVVLRQVEVPAEPEPDVVVALHQPDEALRPVAVVEPRAPGGEALVGRFGWSVGTTQTRPQATTRTAPQQGSKGPPVLHVHVLHHLEPAADRRRVGEHHDRAPRVRRHQRLEPGHLLVVHVHLVDAVRVAAEAHGGEADQQRGAELGGPVGRVGRLGLETVVGGSGSRECDLDSGGTGLLLASPVLASPHQLPRALTSSASAQTSPTTPPSFPRRCQTRGPPGLTGRGMNSRWGRG
jgi:hypothetical protein